MKEEKKFDLEDRLIDFSQGTTRNACMVKNDLLAALPMDQLKLLERRKNDTWRLWLLANTSVG
jgi:hypothetical protein